MRLPCVSGYDKGYKLLLPHDMNNFLFVDPLKYLILRICVCVCVLGKNKFYRIEMMQMNGYTRAAPPQSHTYINYMFRILAGSIIRTFSFKHFLWRC